jgi:protein O-mannosyl-transferase
MLTLGAYVGYVRHPFSLARYLAIIVLFALGLMAKPMLVTLPFVLLLLDYWPFGRMALPAVENRPKSWGDNCTGIPGATVQLSPHQSFSLYMRLVIEKIPLLILAAASCMATLWAQSKAVAVANEHIPLSLRVGNTAVSYVAYLGQFFYPADLAVLYPYPVFGLPIWKVAGAILVLMALSGGVVALRRQCPYLLVGWLWYLGMLVPVIGLVQVGLQAMADRYTYLPQIGLSIALAWGVMYIVRSWPYRRRVCGVASALVIAILMGCAWRQTSFWLDSETLWTHTLACTSQNYEAHNSLGAVLLCQTGREQEAFEHFQQAMRIKPDYPSPHNNLGFVLARAGRLQEAIENYRIALRIKPDYAEAHNNLAIVLAKIGRLQEAIENYQQALQLKPNYTEVYNNLGFALSRAGREQEAIEHFQQALRLKPDYIDAYRGLALAYNNLHRSSEAFASAHKALELARSQGNTELAKQIENWLDSNKASPSDPLSTPPTFKNKD